MIISTLRKNVGTIIAFFGFILLCILTFGDLGDIVTEQYWENVKNNLAGIGFVSVSLTLIQVAIKQGISEQALQKGLNTDNTANKYQEHRALIKSCSDRLIYLPYFLQIYNEKDTRLRKREFLADNEFTSEQTLYLSGKKHLIAKYEKIRTHITSSSIKWATTDIKYNKHGRIQVLSEYRTKRLINAIVSSLMLMVGVAFLTRGLFFDGSNVPLWEKFIKLLGYVIVIAIGSVISVIKDYEKGAFGVPNELEEINQIWREFIAWDIPDWVKQEIQSINENPQEILYERRKKADDGRSIVQDQQKESKDVQDAVSCDVVSVSCVGSSIFYTDDSEFDRQCNGNPSLVR